MVKTASFFFLLIYTGTRAAMSLKTAFLMESGLMVASNLIFLSIWWIFFNQFDHVAGWQMNDMVALMAIGTGAYGIRQICFGGIKGLARMIVSGGLDPFMTQPKNLLLYVAASRSFPKGWGHLMTGIILIVFGGFATFKTLPLILLSIVSGGLVFASIAIIANSLAFWFGSIESLASKYSDSLFLFALYPTNIYSGFLQLVMFTFLPAGIIGYIPIQLLHTFSYVKLCVLLLSSITFFSLASFIFYRGLKRYESGNQFGLGM